MKDRTQKEVQQLLKNIDRTLKKAKEKLGKKKSKS